MICLPLQVDHTSCILDKDIELRDNNHLLIIMHFKAVMTMYLIFHSDVKSRGIKSQGIVYFGV